MCWKHEWAKAVNNLEWAKIHTERARIKVERRNLSEAAQTCANLIGELDDIQGQLRKLIEVYGISTKKDAPSVERNLKGRRIKAGKIAAWVKTN